MKKTSGPGTRSQLEKIFSDRIIDSSRSMITIINRKYIYEKVNKTFCKIHRGTRKAYIGRTLSDVWGEDVFRNNIKKSVDACLGGKTVRYETALDIAGSGERHFEVVFRPVRTGSRKISHVMAETFDISELRKSKKAAEDIRNEFSEMEFSFENRLAQARRFETIGALAGGIAHDFNNILSTISGYTEMIREDYPGEAQVSEKTGKILSAVSKAKQLINQMLTFSHEVEQEKVPVKLNEVLRETVGFVRSASGSGISIRTNYCREEAQVLADPTQLFRVFLNLMTNAIQAIGGNDGKLSVSTSVVDGSSAQSVLTRDIVADSYVMIRFRDNGKGMEQELMRKIFEPFFTSREIGKGTGLGLSVVHGIVSDLEGEIAVSSKPGVGSVFDIYLPVSSSSPKSEELTAVRKKLLFIRGNRYESKVLSIALENSGFEIVYAADPKQLFGIFKRMMVKPDVIIYMTDSEKISTGELRRFYYNLRISIPCILITDSQSEEIEQELLNLGVIRQHLIKPVSLKELKNSIEISLMH